jgi:cellulose synthase (UDP-forming)
MSLIIPVLFLLLGIRCIDASFSEMLSRFLPYFVWHMLTMQWISRGRTLAIMTDVTQVLALPTTVRAVIAGLMRPRGHKFEVTAKGGDRSRRFVEWSLFRTFAILLAFNLAGVAAMTFSIFGKGPAADDTLAFAWSWYNTIVLMITCLVCIERPRYRKAERFTTTGQVGLSIGVSTSIFRIEDISITGVLLTGSSPGETGTTGQCYIGTHRIPCRIERVLPGSFALQFEETLKARIEAVKLFYEQDYVRPMTDVVPALVGKAVIRRIFQ